MKRNKPKVKKPLTLTKRNKLSINLIKQLQNERFKDTSKGKQGDVTA